MASRESFWDTPLGQIALVVVVVVWAAAVIGFFVAIFLVLNYLIFHIPLSTR
jgi:hypothetical protein